MRYFWSNAALYSIGFEHQREETDHFSGEDTDMDVNAYVHESLEKLRELGIDAMAAEKEVAGSIIFQPEEALEAMEEEQILGMLLSNIGAGFHRGTEQAAREIYTFDMEVPDILRMYTAFLEGVSQIAKGELAFTDVEEDVPEEILESGRGSRTVRFRCNGKAYEYRARLDYDWFDIGILAFMNRVLGEQNLESRLYVTSDGYQECVVLYRTEEWARRFRELFGVELEQPGH